MLQASSMSYYNWLQYSIIFDSQFPLFLHSIRFSSENWLLFIILLGKCYVPVFSFTILSLNLSLESLTFQYLKINLSALPYPFSTIDYLFDIETSFLIYFFYYLGLLNFKQSGLFIFILSLFAISSAIENPNFCPSFLIILSFFNAKQLIYFYFSFFILLLFSLLAPSLEVEDLLFHLFQFFNALSFDYFSFFIAKLLNLIGLNRVFDEEGYGSELFSFSRDFLITDSLGSVFLLLKLTQKEVLLEEVALLSQTLEFMRLLKFGKLNFCFDYFNELLPVLVC